MVEKNDQIEAWLTRLSERVSIHHWDLGLERVAQVYERLDLPLLQPPAKPYIITVAGTNGKGTTVAALTALLRQQNIRVGSYTSPHLFSFQERVQINGEMATAQAILDAFEHLEQLRADVPLTWFEFTTLACIDIIAKSEVDVMILEIGLGGRYDAVNIVEPDCAVVTGISFDHTDYLGDTLEKIGYEKAGIYRPQKPAIYVDASRPQSIDEVVAETGAHPFFHGKHFSYKQERDHWQFQSEQTRYEQLPCPHFPVRSWAAALAVLEQSPFAMPNASKLEALIAGTLVQGRMQSMSHADTTILFDVAHNPESAAYLADHLQQWKKHNPQGKIHMLFAMMARKDIEKSVFPLVPLVNQWWPTEPDFELGLKAQNLHEVLAQILAQEQANHASTLSEALADPVAQLKLCLKQLENTARSTDLVVVCGSFYLVGPVMKYLQKTEQLAASLPHTNT